MSGRQHRAGASPRWVPVDQLSGLARCLLSDDLGGRDAVPAQVAARVTALAARWAEHGFTEETIGPWTELAPACAAYLAGRGVHPSVLDLPIDIVSLPKPVTLRRAISTGQIDAERAYELLVSTGVHQASAPSQPASSQPAPSAPAAASAPFVPPPLQQPAADPTKAPPTPAPALFSHSTTDSRADGDRAEPRRAPSPPTRTPFLR